MRRVYPLLLVAGMTLSSPAMPVAGTLQSSQIQAEPSKSQLESEVQALWNSLANRRFTIPDEEIEKELNKWDPWIVDFIPPLEFVRKEEDSYLGAYNPISNTLVVPFLTRTKKDLSWVLIGMFLPLKHHNALVEQINISEPQKPINWRAFDYASLAEIRKWLQAYSTISQKIPEEFRDAIDHELAHAFIDRRFGAPNSSLYSGPNQSGLATNVVRLLKTEHKEKLLELFKAYVPHYEFIAKRLGGIENLISNDFSSLAQKFGKYGNIFRLNYESLRGLPTITVAATIVDTTDENHKVPRFEVRINPLSKYEVNYISKLKNINFRDFQRRYLTLSSVDEEGDIREESYYFKQIPHLKLMRIRSGLGRFHYRISIDESVKKLQELGIPKHAVLEFTDYLALSNAQSKIIGEVTARMIDSLMSVYLGPSTKESWELSEADLEFLGSFRYKGKQMFAKALEKYSIAKRMNQDGISWQDIQSQLEHAITFSYEGKEFYWPANFFKFSKPIPIQN